jgi:P2-related tail formation protein
MADVKTLEPSSPLPFEQAYAAALSDDLPIPYAQIMDPYQTPERFLPWLAAHHSVDLWFDDWSVDRKREMIAQCAGVSKLYPASPLAELKGTFAGLKRYLAFVDAEVIHRVAHPSRFIFGRAVVSQAPINHAAFLAHYLIKVALIAPNGAFQIGRSAFGKAYVRNPDLEPLRRAKRAAVISKSPDTQYTISFAWRRSITFNDHILIDGSHPVDGWIDRLRLS